MWRFTFSYLVAWLCLVVTLGLSDKDCAHFMVLKEAGSGSSWFIDTLDHLSLRNGSSLGPIKREYLHAKIDKHQIDLEFGQSFTKACRGAQRLIGFSQNPCHQYAVAFDDWTLIQKYDVSVIGWLRSNVIHRALNLVRQRLNIHDCPQHNSMSSSIAKRCTEAKYKVEKEYFYRQITRATCENARMLHFVNQTSITGKKPYIMTYERFNVDKHTEAKNLLEYMHVKSDDVDFQSLKSGFEKISNTNVLLQIENSFEVIQWLEKWQSYQSEVNFVQMLKDTAFTNFEHDYKKSCRQLLDSPEASEVSNIPFLKCAA